MDPWFVKIKSKFIFEQNNGNYEKVVTISWNVLNVDFKMLIKAANFHFTSVFKASETDMEEYRNSKACLWLVKKVVEPATIN